MFQFCSIAVWVCHVGSFAQVFRLVEPPARSNVKILALAVGSACWNPALTCHVADVLPYTRIENFDPEAVRGIVLRFFADPHRAALPEFELSVDPLLAGHIGLAAMLEDNALDATLPEHRQRGRLLAPEILLR